MATFITFSEREQEIIYFAKIIGYLEGRGEKLMAEKVEAIFWEKYGTKINNNSKHKEKKGEK